MDGQDIGEFKKRGYLKGTKTIIIRNIVIGAGACIFLGSIAYFVNKIGESGPDSKLQKPIQLMRNQESERAENRLKVQIRRMERARNVAEFASKALRIKSRGAYNKDPQIGMKNDEEKLCQTCKQLFGRSVYDDHVTKCLRAKFSRKNPGDFVICQICQEDISNLRSLQQTVHVNKCIDKSKRQEVLLHNAKSQVADCPLCGQSRKSHLKKCSSQKGISTAELLDKVNEQEATRRSLLEAGIVPPQNSCPPRKRLKKSERNEKKFAADMQRAIDLSVSEDANRAPVKDAFSVLMTPTKKIPARGKKRRPPVKPSRLMEQSAEETRQKIAKKMAAIVVDEVKNNSSEVPNLKESQVRNRSEELQLWSKASSKDVCSGYYVPQLAAHLRKNPSIQRTAPVETLNNTTLIASTQTALLLAELELDQTTLTQPERLANISRLNSSCNLLNQTGFCLEPDEETDPDIGASFEVMLGNQSLSDIVFICLDGQVPAHKFVLCSRLSQDVWRSVENERELNVDVNKDTLLSFLRYLYTGRVPRVLNVQFQSLARKFQVKFLEEACNFERLKEDDLSESSESDESAIEEDSDQRELHEEEDEDILALLKDESPKVAEVASPQEVVYNSDADLFEDTAEIVDLTGDSSQNLITTPDMFPTEKVVRTKSRLNEDEDSSASQELLDSSPTFATQQAVDLTQNEASTPVFSEDELPDIATSPQATSPPTSPEAISPQATSPEATSPEAISPLTSPPTSPEAISPLTSPPTSPEAISPLTSPPTSPEAISLQATSPQATSPLSPLTSPPTSPQTTSPQRVATQDVWQDFDDGGMDEILVEAEEEAMVAPPVYDPPTDIETDVSFMESAVTPVNKACEAKKKGKAPVVPSPFTPMPSYKDMNTPALKREGQKYGVRPMPRKRMTQVLTNIYQETHQYETDSEVDESLLKEKASSDGLNLSSSDDVCLMPEESILIEEKETLKLSRKDVAAKKELVWNFIRGNEEIYRQVLHYEPLEFDDFLLRIKSLGHVIGASIVIEALDDMCMGFTTRSKNDGNRHIRKKRKTDKK
ncbi:hypothetical protein CAPTEDRAFT_223819 [Capitella teleta]|uniref:BTB domain-containing protein n=1 Tax=Capitella teleta TaxID=283909 RepID=R7TQ70_CAPTE|nr:hypothetical protein CAPTEDRAFT_223819 [Capitella teleta]|eukprot:ELT96048.1 hypothetical protein CAPTEDRAFT_223819 [Capitella teleta]